MGITRRMSLYDQKKWKEILESIPKPDNDPYTTMLKRIPPTIEIEENKDDSWTNSFRLINGYRPSFPMYHSYRVKKSFKEWIMTRPFKFFEFYKTVKVNSLYMSSVA